MAKTKLTYIIQSLGVGGAEVALLSAIPKLCAEFDFRLVCLKEYDEKLVAQLTEEEKKSIKVFSGISAYFQAYKYVLKLKPDLIISSLWKGSLLASILKLRNKKISCIQFIHSSTFFHFIDKLVLKFAVKQADAIFCDSASSEKFISAFVPKQTPIEVISFLRFSSPEKFVPKTEIHPKALFVGRFHSTKRIDRLIRFVAELKKEGLLFQVDLYGRDDGTQQEIVSLIEQLDLEKNVLLKGEVGLSEVKKLFPQYDFYFQTSDAEGMAMSVVEAMQHGLVCVLTNVGEIKNYAENNENAIIIPAPFDENFSPAINSIKNVFFDIQLYNKIAENAFNSFKHKEDFPTSLVKTIKKRIA